MLRKKTILIFSQTFVPDPAGVGQYMADVAVELARRGHRVLVYAANRGYENPSIKYAPRENLHGVKIRRLPFSSFGKKNLLIRAFGTFTFMLQCIFIALTTRNLGGIFFSTSPPLIGAAASLARIMRGVPIAYWAMDLNPDQLIAMGKIGARSLVARTLETVNRIILKNSSLAVALDRFMADRLRQRGVTDDQLLVMPPWPHEDHIHANGAVNPFRTAHNLGGKFVIMYSGNHSPANPLDTLLGAVIRLKDDPTLMFLFIGGGLGKKQIEATIREHNLTNALSLPYQPFEKIGESLSAADAHVVALGDNMVGIIHPCKIYGAMAVGKPILYLGPRPSHISDLRLQSLSAAERARIASTAERVLKNQIGQAMLCGELCDRLEQVFRDTSAAAGVSADSSQTPCARSSSSL
jgi:glycosyltransferase involved in cell wall biosynthesis